MSETRVRLVIAALGVSLLLLPLGCEDLPGTSRSQGAVIGGAAGAVAGAAIAENNRLLGALIGAALGAGGGYLIGTTMEHSDADPEDREEAIEAARNAQDNPATAEQARNAATADINNDGFVTMDEVVAMNRAGLSDEEMLHRLEATGQVFELAPEQEDYLVNQGISRNLIERMEKLNENQKDEIYNRSDVIGEVPVKPDQR